MGARANVIIRSDGEQVVLYSHWAGTDLIDTVRVALKRNVRWDDFQYLNRIIFCEMLDGLEGETGFGISSVVHDGEFPDIEIDVDNQTVTINGKVKSFSDFITRVY